MGGEVKGNVFGQKVTRLSDGWFMVEPASDVMASLLYSLLDAEEMDELETVGMDREAFVRSMTESGHSAMFFAGADLVFGVAASWVHIDGRRVRIWDTMSTRYVREKGYARSFVKHTPEMLDAFSLGEPCDEYFGIVKSDFARSRKWIERCAKFEEYGHIGINNVWHTIYRHKKED